MLNNSRLSKVDVVMCTWNSNKPWFRRCLNSIKNEIPICHFIVVDRFSSDGTVEAIRKIFPEAIVVKSKLNLGRARKNAIMHVDTEWFCFIDDDIELCHGWFNRIANMIEGNVGAIHGIHIDINLDHIYKYSYWNLRRIRKLYPGGIVDLTLKNLNIRGYTTNTFLMTKLLKSWNPPLWLTSYEDHHLLRHVVSQGYKWRMLLNLTVKHYTSRSIISAFKKSRWNAAGGRAIGFLNNKIIYKSVIRNMVKAVLASINTGTPLIIPYALGVEIGKFQGYIGWKKYLQLSRNPV
ncbi:MAG: glycosyltransferase family 2 protein [Candidatus Methanomethylicia archaeon]